MSWALIIYIFVNGQWHTMDTFYSAWEPRTFRSNFECVLNRNIARKLEADLQEIRPDIFKDYPYKFECES